MKPGTALAHATLWLAAAVGALANATPAEPTATAALNGKQTAGSSLFRYWGFEIYQASLHVPAGFDPARYEQQPLGLALDYRRAFKGSDIAQRSIDEMQAISALTPQQTSEWKAAMVRAFPDVKAGDQLLGVHLPGQGAHFYYNGRLHATVADPVFSARFFGIWLSPKTSAPQLRAALIDGVPR